MDVELVSGGLRARCQGCQPLRCQRSAAATRAENRRSTGRGLCHIPERKAALTTAHLDKNKQVPGELGRDPRLIQSIASLIRGQSQLLLLERPDAVEDYKLNKLPVRSKGAGTDQLYLPRVPRKPSNLASMRASLRNSCPYLYDQRRGSLSSVSSQKTGNWNKKQSNLKALAEAKKSNVTVTMTYLGRRHARSGTDSLQDELRVLQQVNGGENICVFKGTVTPGEQFQFLSQRHRGYPFSATMYVNGLMAARISSCCEYRYSPGFQQGRRSCFRLAWLSGGLPCHRCTSLRNKYGSCQQLNNGTKDNSIPPLDRNAGKDTAEHSGSAPLLLPAKPEKKKKKKKTLRQRTGEHSRVVSCPSTDSEEDPAPAAAKHSSKPKRREGRSGPREYKGETGGTGGEGKKQGSQVDPKGSKVPGGCDDRTSTHKQVQADQESPGQVRTPQVSFLLLVLVSLQVGPQDEEALTRHKVERKTEPGTNEKSRDGDGTKDYYEECLDMSAALERSPNQHNWFKANILERCRLKKLLASGPPGTSSDLEPSEESDDVVPPEEQSAEPVGDGLLAEPEVDRPPAEPVGDRPPAEPLDAMMAVLNASDEVDQLVLRNTDLTDDLLWNLAEALKRSPSEVTLLNLNLNLIGPYGAHILLDLVRAKPQVKGLHLFGNKLRDHGIQILVNGIVELQEQTASEAAIQQTMLLQSEQRVNPDLLVSLHATWGTLRIFTLLELDIGGNGLASDGLRLLAAYMRHYSFLRYLGLAQTSGADLAAWKELFDSLKENSSLTQIVLDESNLGDPGVRMLADVLKVSVSLRRVDLDRNDISDVGGNDLMGALLCRTQFPLRHLSLQENDISPGLMRRIQEEVKNT
ncbi:unnamed protein product [Lota lota]